MTSIQDFPTRPGEIPDFVPLGALVERHAEHVSAVVDHRHSIGAPLPATAVAEHALAHLACSHALAKWALYGRWGAARDALHAGAAVADVAHTMALDVAEVATGLTRRADGQRRFEYSTNAERAEVLLLPAGRGGAR